MRHPAHPGLLDANSEVLRHPRDQYTIRLLEAIPNPFGGPGNHVTR